MTSVWDDLQRLTASQGALLYRLVTIGAFTQNQVDELFGQLTGDRFTKAEEYWRFAKQLDSALPLNQPQIVSRCYYAMYHAARSLVLYVRRADLDDHERLPAALGQLLGTKYGDSLSQWRERRNQIDYSPYTPPDLSDWTRDALADSSDLIAACRQALQARGVAV